MHGFYANDKTAALCKRNRHAARSKLQRKGLADTGKLVEYFFNVFINCESRILASHVVEKGLCPPGKFSIWRQQMKDLGLIYWNQVNEKKWAYFPGPDLVQYINKEKNLTKELATTEELYHLEKRLTDMVIDAIDPYTNDEKREKFARGEYKNQFKIVKSENT